jgi:hypothetical protein
MGLLRLMGNKADVVKGLAKRSNENWSVAPKSDIVCAHRAHPSNAAHLSIGAISLRHSGLNRPLEISLTPIAPPTGPSDHNDPESESL